MKNLNNIYKQVEEKKMEIQGLILQAYQEGYKEGVSKGTNEPEADWTVASQVLPEDCEPVIVTYVNHNPPPYYDKIKDVPQVAIAVLCKGDWYWWHATIVDFLKEYGRAQDWDLIDSAIEIIAWKPFPKPYAQ